MEDQKVSFNLFEAMKHPNDLKSYFDMNKIEQEIDKVAIAMALHYPLSLHNVTVIPVDIESVRDRGYNKHYPINKFRW